MAKLLTVTVGMMALVLPTAVRAAEPLAMEREAVLRLISDYGSDPESVLSGQNVGHANGGPREGYARLVAPLSELTGQLPAILSMDYGYNEIPYDLQVANQLLIDHWRAGGLVMVSMHPSNPWTRDDCHDLGHGEFSDLFQTGTAVQAVWSGELERVARGLSMLKDAGVVVLWRPFHEVNGGWFWWGSNEDGRWLSAEDFRRLWQETFLYLTEEKELDNLLWVYSPAVRSSRSEKPVNHYYPGDDLVDLLALDWYTDNPTWSAVRASYQQLAEHGKPIGLAEFGPLKNRHGTFDNRRLLNLLRDTPMSLAFFSYWHSWEGAAVAIGDNRHARSLMLDPITVNRAELARRLSKARKTLSQSKP